MKLDKVAYERENIYSDFLISKRDIERIFHACCHKGLNKKIIDVKVKWDRDTVSPNFQPAEEARGITHHH